MVKQMLGQLIVRVADLAEAEARLAKRGAFRLVVAVLVATLAAAIVGLATIIITAAIYVALLRVIPVDAACGTIGVGLLIVAGICALVAAKLGCSR